jgi:hypothetical protein
MRTREEIELSLKTAQSALESFDPTGKGLTTGDSMTNVNLIVILEVLLDIRELLNSIDSEVIK